MIYLDNNATTRPNADMLNAAREVVYTSFGNPSSLHLAGLEARDTIEWSREQIACALGAEPSEIIFTSGGTEANTLAYGDPQNDFSIHISTTVEHSSIAKCNSQFVLSVDQNGFPDFNKLESYLKTFSSTVLVSVMMANNETGVILDPEGTLFNLKQKYDFKLHVDAVQGFGKLPIDLQTMPIDLLSISGHKVHGLKGAGALYVRSNLDAYPKPIFFGGSHERNYRPGTENQIGIYSLGYIAYKLQTDLSYKERNLSIRDKRDAFEHCLSDISEVNGSTTHRISNTSNLYFPQIIDLDLFLELLSENGVYASGKSACASGMPAPSKVIAAMYGKNSPRLEGSVRFSLSVETTDEHISDAVFIIRNTIDQCVKLQEFKK